MAVKEQIDTMQVEMNKLIVSIKINEILDDPQDKIKRELALNLLFDLYFSKSSSLYNEWLEKGYINETFSASFTQERDYAFILMGGDQDDYELLQKTIFNFIDHVQDLEIAEDDFERIKRKTIGNFINSYNSPENIANTFSRYYFEGICSFDLVDYVSKMTLADINEVKRYFNKEYASSYIVKKGEKNYKTVSYEDKTLSNYCFNTDTSTYTMALSRSGDGRSVALISYNSNGEAQYTINTEHKADSLSVYKGTVAILDGNVVYGYNQNGDLLYSTNSGTGSKKIVLASDYTAYILSVNQIRFIDLDSVSSDDTAQTSKQE